MKSDILHLKSFHPTNDWFGLSITEAISREIDSSNEAIEWQKKVLENEGRPGMAVFIHGFLSDPQWDRLEGQLNSKYGGSQNAGKTIIIEGEQKGDIKPYSWSPKEMDWIESNRELSRRICNGYGIPPMLLGIPGDNTYSNQKEARLSFWEETINYYLNFISDELNNWFFGDDKSICIEYDLSGNYIMAYKQELIWTRIKDASFMTINEKRQAVGLEKFDDPNADEIFVPFGQVPLSQSDVDMSQETNPEVVQGYDEETSKQITGNAY